MFELVVSPIREYNLTICEGRVVVRSLARINALLDVWTKDLEAKHRRILADVTFDGSGSDEEIIWSTDEFNTTPKKLSELCDGDAEFYRSILKETLLIYAKSIANAPKDVRKLLYSAITYISEESVFCADGRIILTEWGVQPTDKTDILGMPYGVEVHSDKDEPKNEEAIVNSKGVNKSPQREPSDGPTNSNNNLNRRKKRFNKTWFWIIPVIVLITLLVFLIHGCKSHMESVRDVAPDIATEDIVISSDSINFVASNRFILIIGNPEASLESFVEDFRNSYPDESKYILSNSDSQFST